MISPRGEQVDREKMAQTQLRVDEHIRSGGMLCFFPEGQLNPNPAEIMVHCLLGQSIL
jgi:hypothetical protein